MSEQRSHVWHPKIRYYGYISGFFFLVRENKLASIVNEPFQYFLQLALRFYHIWQILHSDL